MENITIHDVARHAGVSSATVSRVLNQSDKVLPDTRKRVLEAVEKLNYSPNASSRNLRTNHSRTVLVILPTLSNPFYGDILSGMDDCTHDNGYNLLVTVSDSSQARERELLKLLYQHRADGVILMSSTLPPEELTQLNEQFPVVQCCECRENIGVPFVSVDNYGAFYEATMYILKSGHRRIALSSSANNFPSTKHREQAFKQAHADMGVEIDPQLIRQGGYSFESGYENMQIFLRMKNTPTAVMGVSDVVAAGAISAIVNANLKVPDDIAVMGFDDLDMARMIQPTLSTVMQPKRRIGQAAVELLFERMNGVTEAHELLLPYELVIRHST